MQKAVNFLGNKNKTSWMRFLDDSDAEYSFLPNKQHEELSLLVIMHGFRTYKVHFGDILIRKGDTIHIFKEVSTIRFSLTQFEEVDELDED